jgi:hypothetical protein
MLGILGKLCVRDCGVMLVETAGFCEPAVFEFYLFAFWASWEQVHVQVSWVWLDRSKQKNTFGGKRLTRIVVLVLSARFGSPWIFRIALLYHLWRRFSSVSVLLWAVIMRFWANQLNRSATLVALEFFYICCSVWITRVVRGRGAGDFVWSDWWCVWGGFDTVDLGVSCGYTKVRSALMRVYEVLLSGRGRCDATFLFLLGNW